MSSLLDNRACPMKPTSVLSQFFGSVSQIRHHYDPPSFLFRNRKYFPPPINVAVYLVGGSQTNCHLPQIYQRSLSTKLLKQLLASASEQYKFHTYHIWLRVSGSGQQNLTFTLTFTLALFTAALLLQPPSSNRAAFTCLSSNSVLYEVC